jgi:diguanylate cyclase (GGDEF)-like protein
MHNLADLAAAPLWQRLLDELSAQLGTPVYAVDTFGVKVSSGGRQALFCELQERTGKCHECRQHWTESAAGASVQRCHANLLNLVAPIEHGKRRLGALIASALLTDTKDIPTTTNAELADAAGSLHIHPRDGVQRKLGLLQFFARLLPELAAAELERQQSGRELGLLLEYAELAASAPSLERLIQSTAVFLGQKLRLSNCAVLFAGRQHRLYPTAAQGIEDLAWKTLRSTRTTLAVASPRNDFLLRNAPEAAGFQGSFAAVPVLVENELAGAFYLYRERDVRAELGLLLRIAEKLQQSAARIKLLEQAQASAVTDPLTGLFNRALFTEALRAELHRATLDGRPTSLLIFDVDNFKQFNDTHGHVAGDQVLRQVAESAKASLRPQDATYRYGGEEFVAILPATPPDQAQAVAEHLRATIQARVHLTVSIGLVTCLNSSAAPGPMLEEADRALYKAKAGGKNKVIPFIIVDRSLGTVDVEQARTLGMR